MTINDDIIIKLVESTTKLVSKLDTLFETSERLQKRQRWIIAIGTIALCSLGYAHLKPDDFGRILKIIVK